MNDLTDKIDRETKEAIKKLFLRPKKPSLSDAFYEGVHLGCRIMMEAYEEAKTEVRLQTGNEKD